jgi:hypothetical protein
MTNTNGKVTVSREVAESIEKARQHHDNEWFVDGYYSGAVSAYPGLFGLPLDTLIRALYVGYEVEKTPEEKVFEYLANLDRESESYFNHSQTQDQYKAQANAVRCVLELLNITLPEVDE